MGVLTSNRLPSFVPREAWYSADGHEIKIILLLYVFWLYLLIHKQLEIYRLL